jgi:hypothetical protein
MIEQDYTDFCNVATDLVERAEGYFARISDETLHQLRGLVRSEMAASPGGTVAPGYDFLAGMLDAEVEDRERHPMKAFQTAMLDFTSAKCAAISELVAKLTALPNAEWNRARDALQSWIANGCSNEKAYRRVVDEVDYERARLASSDQAHPAPKIPF